MTKKSEKDFISATFRFEGKLHEQFMDLVFKTNSSSQMECLRRTITLASKMVEAQQDGETIVLRNKAKGADREVLVLW